jgi:hypothetical protein
MTLSIEGGYATKIAKGLPDLSITAKTRPVGLRSKQQEDFENR